MKWAGCSFVLVKLFKVTLNRHFFSFRYIFLWCADNLKYLIDLRSSYGLQCNLLLHFYAFVHILIMQFFKKLKILNSFLYPSSSSTLLFPYNDFTLTIMGRKIHYLLYHNTPIYLFCLISHTRALETNLLDYKLLWFYFIKSFLFFPATIVRRAMSMPRLQASSQSPLFLVIF